MLLSVADTVPMFQHNQIDGPLFVEIVDQHFQEVTINYFFCDNTVNFKYIFICLLSFISLAFQILCV